MEGLTLDELTAHVATQAHGDDSLDRLDAAITIAAHLDHQADALVDHFVAAARAAGRSWTDIGARLGVTKQAARKRFTDLAPPAPVLPPGVTLGARLRTCLAAAEHHAQRAGATEVHTEHLLAGLLAEGIAAAILDKLGVTAEAINASAQRLFGPAQPAGDHPPPLSADAICAIEGAAHHIQAVAAHQPTASVGTENLLLVLALDPGARARRVLTDLNADIALIKKELACHTALHPPRPRRFGRRRQTRPPTCSFCGTTETATRRLAHGPGVAICGTCAERARQATNTPRTDTL
jgi:ClpX C4-type zinc finger/Clp amino terminal domain, pathogenicity island component